LEEVWEDLQEKQYFVEDAANEMIEVTKEVENQITKVGATATRLAKESKEG
jgi:hypothetical protein